LAEGDVGYGKIYADRPRIIAWYIFWPADACISWCICIAICISSAYAVANNSW